MNLFQDYVAELSIIDINNPDFENTSKVHDWRNYVPYDWQKNWAEFTERERQIIAVMSLSQADNEEWDWPNKKRATVKPPLQTKARWKAGAKLRKNKSKQTSLFRTILNYIPTEIINRTNQIKNYICRVLTMRH